MIESSYGESRRHNTGLIAERSIVKLMYLQFTPWVALFLGLLIGWLLEWFFELFRFRRDRLACQQRLASLEAELAARQADIEDASRRVAALQAELAIRNKEGGEP